MKKIFTGIALSAALAATLTGCGNNNSDFVFGVNPVQAQPVASPSPAATPTPVTDVQVEQLARPAINEGTLVTNKFLNTYNAVGPDFIAAALANSTSAQGQAAGPVLAESVSSLIVFASLNTTVNATNYVTNTVVPAVLPDVLRIDTTLNIAVNATAYSTVGNLSNGAITLIGGRKLTDDVVDFTLAFLSAGAVAPAGGTAATPTAGGDNVPYYRPTSGPGSANPNIGHQNLNGQTTPFGAATFPYLAPAN